MRSLCAVFVLFCCAPFVGADEPTMKEARQRFLRGNYEEARANYETLAKNPKTLAAASIGISQTWQSEGEYDKAVATIEAAVAKETKSPDLLARHAELLFLRGKWKEAESAAEKALALDKDHFQARWIRAQVYRDRGEMAKADTECRWFIRAYGARGNGDEIKDPDQLIAIGLAASENARWHNISDQFEIILNDIYADALKADKSYWPAEYLSGMLLLEKYNYPSAITAFNNALKINPSAAEPLVALGRAALQKLQIKEAEQFAERALKINVRHPEALQLRADLHLFTGEFDQAMKELETARKVNPRDERTLARIAACLHSQKKKAEFDAIVQEVAKNNPTPGEFYSELGERLDERRQYDVAEGYYKKAIELRPMLPSPHSHLGFLLMRMGREDEARKLMEEAWRADPFNVMVRNTRAVLKHLDGYETIKTEHFALRFDPKTDRPLARYMAEQLEIMYAELAQKFQYSPKGPILVEVFNNHDMFSGRVIALPDLHTIGACTGRMFAMVSPRFKGLGKPFNWSRVLRHELVHIFNLEQTNFQVPHWLTEGLAVINEQMARPQSWNQLLMEKVPAGDLLTLDNVNLAFMRPTSAVQWQQAYCQSQLYVEYLEKKHGAKAIGEMLQAYADGLDTGPAIAKVCKVDKATFEKGYLAYLQDVVKGLKGRPAEKPMTFAQLKAAHDKTPGDIDISARLAEHLLTRDKATTRKLVDEVLAKKKNHPIASYVKARLLENAGDDDEARKVMEAALDPKDPEPKLVLALAKLYYEAKEFDKAVVTLELGRKSQPSDSRWLTELLRVYSQQGNKNKQIEILKELVPTDSDDLETRKRLTKLLLDAGRHAEAEQYARQALEIDIYDPGIRETLYEALIGQKKQAEADRLKKLLEG